MLRALHLAWRYARRLLYLAWIALVRLAGVLILLWILGDGVTLDDSLRARVTSLARNHLFDYVSWEIDALWEKTQQELLGTHYYLDDGEQRIQVLTYLEQLADAQEIEAQIERAYSNPYINDPLSATVDLRAERDRLRADLDASQPLVEGIIESQVSAVLTDAGFDLLGQVMPPVSMHFTELPTLLVISPRDHIEFKVDINLTPLTIEQRETLEAQIERELDVSALIVPLGGLSLYPSMITESPSLARAFEVTAHEWTHHYLVFFPLGWEYDLRPETRIINETVATFLGREVATQVMARYYADQTQPVYASYLQSASTSPTESQAEAENPARDPDAPEPFDYYSELDNTRRQVDFLLWMGRIEAAETYMEYRRREFVRHGYGHLRKLNQAYFAFYGGYQATPGAGGSDPTGSAVEELRLLSPDLKTWLETLRGITTRDELLATLEAHRSD